jgi:hypothetical protein
MILPQPVVTYLSDEPVPTGVRELDSGQAMTFRPQASGDLRIIRGELWATFDGPHGGTPGDSGDVWLKAGDRLRVHAGQRLVIESWRTAPKAHFLFDAEEA